MAICHHQYGWELLSLPTLTTSVRVFGAANNRSEKLYLKIKTSLERLWISQSGWIIHEVYLERRDNWFEYNTYHANVVNKKGASFESNQKDPHFLDKYFEREDIKNRHNQNIKQFQTHFPLVCPCCKEVLSLWNDRLKTIDSYQTKSKNVSKLRHKTNE